MDINKYKIELEVEQMPRNEFHRMQRVERFIRMAYLEESAHNDRINLKKIIEIVFSLMLQAYKKSPEISVSLPTIDKGVEIYKVTAPGYKVNVYHYIHM